MSNFLQVTQIPSSGKVPLIMEIQVSPHTAPYLVTSSQSVLWVPEAMKPTPEFWKDRLPEHVVRVAVRLNLREKDVGSFFLEALNAIEAMGREAAWGNVHPFSEAGIEACLEHVSHYELGDLCLLTPRDDASIPLKDIAKHLGLLPQPCSWVPADCAVVVPKDREYVGLLGLLGRKGSVGLVHNASRAVGIARGVAG